VCAWDTEIAPHFDIELGGPRTAALSERRQTAFDEYFFDLIDRASMNMGVLVVRQ
jgi:hypothetical protein